jgi:hypothetical protein
VAEKENIDVEPVLETVALHAFNLLQPVPNGIDQIGIANIALFNQSANKLPKRKVKAAPQVLQLDVAL